MKKLHEYSTKEHWEKFWTGIQYKKNFKAHYHPLIKKLLPKNNNWTCFEIGCVPGNFLMYFYQQFGYKPAGIDYSDNIDMVRQYFKKQRVPIELYKQDFFEFQPRKKYNVVISTGFVEHFSNPELVFKKHFDLVAENGWLIISMPNFRNIQYYLHKIFDSKTLKTHNFEVMYPSLWRTLAQKNSMKIHYCDYYETFGFWIINKSALLRPLFKTIAFLTSATRFSLKKLGLMNMTNKYLSPHIILIAQKP